MKNRAYKNVHTHTQSNFLNIHTGTVAPPNRNAMEEEGILSARTTPMGKSLEKVVVQKNWKQIDIKSKK